MASGGASVVALGIAVGVFLLGALSLCAQILARRSRDFRRSPEADRHLRPRASMDLQALGHLLLLHVLFFAAGFALLYAFGWLLAGLAVLVPPAAALGVPISCPRRDCRGKAYLRSLRPVLYRCRKCGAAHAMSLGLGRR